MFKNNRIMGRGIGENRVKELSFAFALRIIKLAQFLEQEKKAYVLSKRF